MRNKNLLLGLGLLGVCSAGYAASPYTGVPIHTEGTQDLYLYQVESGMFLHNNENSNPTLDWTTRAHLHQYGLDWGIIAVAGEDADGNAIGGLAVGEPVDKMYEMIEIVNEILPKDKPRYLMGVGTPVNILEGIERGVDMFDCVMPTRNGRNGMLFTKDGIINMRNKKWETDFSPIEADGASSVDTLYSKAYLRHLFHAQELLAMQIASIHNLAFYLWLAGEARKHIIAGDFSTWKPMMVKRVSTRL